MKVAVVGATGVLGQALIPQLAQQHEVRALARSTETMRRLFADSAEAVECDLLASETVKKLPTLLSGCDAVIHAATAIPKQAEMGKPGAWEVNNRLRTEGTAHLLATALQIGARVYLQQSIVMAYPDSGDHWISEETPLVDPQSGQPINAAVSEMERLVRAVPTTQLRWCILRGGTFVGKDTFQDDTIADLRTGGEKAACDGRAYLPLIHVEDIASAFVAALDHAPAGSTFNIVDKPIRQGEYLDKLAAAVGAAKPSRDPNLPCPPSRRCSNQLARDVLGWSATRSLIPANS